MSPFRLYPTFTPCDPTLIDQHIAFVYQLNYGEAVSNQSLHKKLINFRIEILTSSEIY